MGVLDDSFLFSVVASFMKHFSKSLDKSSNYKKLILRGVYPEPAEGLRIIKEGK